VGLQAHYTRPTFKEQILGILEREGLSEPPIPWDKFAALDQFHIRGLQATKELAALMDLKPEDRVLDVGSGLGGPARYIATTYGCHVTGIDLTPTFVEGSAWLAELSGLAEKLTFVQGDALQMPFPDAGFDVALTQHVAMNIADRETFYQEIRRVLKLGGRLGIYDVVEGNGEPLIFPVPWSPTQEFSHLRTFQNMADILRGLGFHLLTDKDFTQEAIVWFEKVRGRLDGAELGLDLRIAVGPDFPTMTKNLAANLEAGRVGVSQSVWRRA
jgi:ubiquinone/menaquinone biosynthesis C-methylase UbiE